MIVDGVEVTICCAEEVSEDEVRAYIKFLREKEQADISDLSIDITSNGQASLAYRTNPLRFERIRRITGYLVGTINRWNNAKRQEEQARCGGSTMTIRIFSDESLLREELQKIKQIFDETECPNEALRRTFPRYVATDGNGVHFGSMEAASNMYEVDIRDPK